MTASHVSLLIWIECLQRAPVDVSALFEMIILQSFQFVKYQCCKFRSTLWELEKQLLK